MPHLFRSQCKQDLLPPLLPALTSLWLPESSRGRRRGVWRDARCPALAERLRLTLRHSRADVLRKELQRRVQRG